MFENILALRYVASCVIPCMWMVVSSALILLNKYLMRDKGFGYPMMMSSLGQIFSALAAAVVCRVFKIGNASKHISLRYYMFNIIPIGFFMALTLMAGNAVYMYLTVSFIQMLKAFTPVFTMVGLFMAGLEVPTLALIGSVMVIACGTALAGYGEINFSVIGVLLMALSESAEALRLVMTQFMLQGLNFHPIEGLMYLSPACVVWVLLGVWLFEWERMVQNNAIAIVKENALMFTAAATLGFVCNGLVFFTIQLCGSLTLKVLGTSKNAGLVLFCVVFLGERVTSLQGCGYTVALAGFSWYQHIKIMQASEKNKDANKHNDLESIPLNPSGSKSGTPKSAEASSIMRGIAARR